MTKYYVDKDGNYIGGFDGAPAPKGAIEVVEAPKDARQVYDLENGVFGDYENEEDALIELHNIDMKSIRALRTGDTERLTELENQAIVLRGKLK
jgi:hypothetical protein